MSREVSRRSAHGDPTNPRIGLITPGHSVLTASFATKGSRVQIPSAPLKALVMEVFLPVPNERFER